MESWHAAACRRPDVYLAGDIPFCTSCDTPGPGQSRQSTESVDISFSRSDHSRRQLLNLSWPATVTYSDECPCGHDGEDITNDIVKQLNLSSRERTSNGQEAGDSALLPTQAFSPLNSKTGFRILCLSSGEWNDPLHGSFETLQLNLSDDFETVSYTWADETGDTSRCQNLFIGSAWNIVPITRNCDLVLRHLRRGDRNRKLWIDAVCIDQTSVTERTHQVGLMTQIYSSARRCVVYIGEASHGSENVLSHLSFSDPSSSIPDWLMDGASHLFKRRYFTRLWILQEIVCSRRVSVMCGDVTIEWKELMERRWPLEIDCIKPTWLRNFGWFGNQPADLSRILYETSGCSSSDPRDRVFALFGLLHDGMIEGLVADYDLDLDQVYTGIAAYLLCRQAATHILIQPRASFSSLPSWVPDWRTVHPHDWALPSEPGQPSTQLLDLGKLLQNFVQSLNAALRTQPRAAELGAGVRGVHDVPRMHVQPVVRPPLPSTTLHMNGALNQFEVHRDLGCLNINCVRSIRLDRFFQRNGHPRVYTKCFGGPFTYQLTWILVTSSELSVDGRDWAASIDGVDVFLHLRSCSLPNTYRIVGHCIIALKIGLDMGCFPKWLSYPSFLDSTQGGVYFQKDLGHAVLVSNWTSSPQAPLLWRAFYWSTYGASPKHALLLDGAYVAYRRFSLSTTPKRVIADILHLDDSLLNSDEITAKRLVQCIEFWSSPEPWIPMRSTLLMRVGGPYSNPASSSIHSWTKAVARVLENLDGEMERPAIDLHDGEHIVAGDVPSPVESLLDTAVQELSWLQISWQRRSRVKQDNPATTVLEPTSASQLQVQTPRQSLPLESLVGLEPEIMSRELLRSKLLEISSKKSPKETVHSLDEYVTNVSEELSMAWVAQDVQAHFDQYPEIGQDAVASRNVRAAIYVAYMDSKLASDIDARQYFSSFRLDGISPMEQRISDKIVII